MKDVYKITERFEEELCKYTNSKYAVAVDNCSNALFLSLMYEKLYGNWDHITEPIIIPSHTYPSVPCEILHAGGKVEFKESNKFLKGAYKLDPTNVWDSSLRFTNDMYISGSLMCLSFTGAYKHLKLSKGGAILTDNYHTYLWLKKARFSGRNECSYHDDNFDDNPVIGWNFYMLPEIAARGLILMNQFYDINDNPIENEDKEISYPDLSKFKVYT
jgi:dTDP-4-amino-4,6-dideoxygalactose transaminase